MSRAPVLVAIPDEIRRGIIALADDVHALRDPGDESVMFLHGETEWVSGVGGPSPISIQLPGDWDFHVGRVGLFLQSKLVDRNNVTGSTSDLTYRPAWWSYGAYLPDNFAPDTYVLGDANASVTIEDTFNGPWNKQGYPIVAAALYSAPYGMAPMSYVYPLTAWVGPRTLPCPQRVKSGSVITVQVTPSFGRVETGRYQTYFRAQLVLSGVKVVRGAP